MTDTLCDISFRPPKVDDVQEVLDFMRRCEVAEYGEHDSDMEDLLYDWGKIDLNCDAWLAINPAGELLGYGAVLPWSQDFRCDIFVDSGWANTDLGEALLARCEKRVLSTDKMEREGGEVMVKTYIAHVNKRDRDTVMGAGFESGRHIFQMRIFKESAPIPPAWKYGLSVRTAIPTQDDRVIYELIQAAFEKPGRTSQSFDDWKDFMMREDIFDADLWFLAVSGADIVGACLCYEYPDSGWVRQLAVARTWRRRGVGAALLLQAFGEFWKRGYAQVGLTVESDNPNAQAFYKKVGMHCVRQYDEYSKPLRFG